MEYLIGAMVHRGKCLESGANSRRSADVWKIHQGSDIQKRIGEREEEMRTMLWFQREQ